MTSNEILAELPKLGVDESAKVFDRLCELQEQDILHGLQPTDAEKELLDRELEEYERDRNRGFPSEERAS